MASNVEMERMLYCPRCKQEKPESQFNRSKQTTSGRHTYCKACCTHYYKNVYKGSDNEKLSQRKAHLKKDRGITMGRYWEMLKEQGGKCKICESYDNGNKRNKYFCVDHDHKTGKVRGLLCHPCNSAIGKLKDDPVLIQKALDYLLEKKTDYRNVILFKQIALPGV